MQSLSFLLVSTIALVKASDVVILTGTCENLSMQGGMNWPEFLGNMWYEVHRYPVSGNEVNCIEMYLNKTDSANYTLQIHGMQNDKMVHEKADVQINAENIGHLLIGNRVIKVLDSDQNSYAILHECVYNKDTNNKTISSWIFSRDVYLRAKDIEKVAKYYTDHASPELKLNLHEAVVHWGDTCSGCSLNSAVLSLILACMAFVKML